MLRWPFYGALLAIAVDLSDLFMMNLLDLGGVRDYQGFDKYLDQVYLFTFLLVALRWSGPARTISIVLYCFRMTGFLAFELTQERAVLMLFPNFFEYWFILIAGLYHFGWDPFPRSASAPAGTSSAAMDGTGAGVALATKPTRRALPADVFRGLLAALVALKLFQEYALHYGRWLDGFTTVEAIEAVWRFLTPPF